MPDPQKNVWWDTAIPFLRSYDLLAFRLIKTYFEFSLTILGSIPEYEMKTPSRRAQLLPGPDLFLYKIWNLLQSQVALGSSATPCFPAELLPR